MWSRRPRRVERGELLQLAAALALALGPLVPAYGAGPAAVVGHGSGLLLVLVALAGGPGFRPWKGWLRLLVASWLLLSPWLLGFAGNAIAGWTQLALGVALGALAATRLRQLPPAPASHSVLPWP